MEKEKDGKSHSYTRKLQKMIYHHVGIWNSENDVMKMNDDKESVLRLQVTCFSKEVRDNILSSVHWK